MSITAKIQSVRNTFAGIRPIEIEPFFSDETKAQLTAWNDELTKHRASLAELGQEAASLVDSATSGECSRPAGIITELSKVSQKLKRFKIETINLLTAKRPLWPLVQEGYKQEAARWQKEHEKRKAELEKFCVDMDPRAAHFAALSDPQRREKEDAAKWCSSKANEHILSNAELQLLEDLQLSFQDLF